MAMRKGGSFAAVVLLAVALALIPAASAQGTEHLTGWQLADKDDAGRYSRFVVVNDGHTSAIVTIVGYLMPGGMQWVDIPDFALVINENRAVDIPEIYRDASRIAVLTTRGNLWAMKMRPIADFSQARAADNSVQFNDSSIDKDGWIDSWRWDFGDNSTSTNRNPSHLYTGNGTFMVTLTVADDDGLTDTTSENISSDFTVTINPTSGSVTQGSSTNATVSVTRLGVFGGTVSLTASGLPSSASASFSPSSGTPSFNSTMTISTSSSTPAGTYTVTVTGTGGGLTRTATYSLTVTASGGGGGEPPPPPPPPPPSSTRIAVSVGSADAPSPSSAQATVAGVTKALAPGSWTYWDVSPGTYTVTFSSVSYYRTPNSQNVSVSSGQTTSTIGYYSIGKWRFLQAGELGYQAAQGGITDYRASDGWQQQIRPAKATIGLGWNNGDQFWTGGTVSISFKSESLFISISCTPTSTTPSAGGTLITVNARVTGTWTAYSGPRVWGTSVIFGGTTGAERAYQDTGWIVRFV